MENFASTYINRAKTLITRTNSIGLIFLFTLTYVWYKSVLPNQEVIKKIVDLKQKSLYFDTIYNSLRSTDSINVHELYVRRDSIKNLIRNQDTLHPTNVAYKIFQYDTSFKRSLVKKQQRFNKAVAVIKKQTDSVKQKLEDSLKTAQFEIEVPTLSSVKTDFNLGFPIWMFLATFFLIYMSINRNLVAYYFKKGLNIFSKNKLNDNQIENLDIQLPFWIYPVKFDDKVRWGKKINEIISNSWVINKTIITGCLIILVLFMEFKIVALVWNINNFGNVYKEQLFPHSLICQISTFFLFSISLIISIVWFFPYNLNFTNEPKENIDFFKSRRNFLKYALIGGGAFFLQFTPLNVAIPRTKPSPFDYRRKRPTKNIGTKTNLSGFYINNNSKTIHYFFDNGTSLTLKTIPSKSQVAFIQRLEAINIFDYIMQLQTRKIKFPNSIYPIEVEAKKLLSQRLYLRAFELIKLGIEINYGNSADRLIFLLIKLFKAHKQNLGIRQRIKFHKFLRGLNNRHYTIRI